MRQNGLVTQRTHQLKRLADSEHAWPMALNLFDQDFAADGTDHNWGAGISDLWSAQSWLNRAVMIDLYS